MIRTAEKSDIKQWSRMRTELWPDTPDEHVGEIEEYFRGESPDIVETFILEENNSIIGFLELNVRSYAEGSREKRVPFVEAWYIDVKHRGNGKGRALIEAAEHWCQSNGYSELASDTELASVGSQKAHIALGFREVERVVCYLKNLT